MSPHSDRVVGWNPLPAEEVNPHWPEGWKEEKNRDQETTGNEQLLWIQIPVSKPRYHGNRKSRFWLPGSWAWSPAEGRCDTWAWLNTCFQQNSFYPSHCREQEPGRLATPPTTMLANVCEMFWVRRTIRNTTETIRNSHTRQGLKTFILVCARPFVFKGKKNRETDQCSSALMVTMVLRLTVLVRSTLSMFICSKRRFLLVTVHNSGSVPWSLPAGWRRDLWGRCRHTVRGIKMAPVPGSTLTEDSCSLQSLMVLLNPAKKKLPCLWDITAPLVSCLRPFTTISPCLGLKCAARQTSTGSAGGSGFRMKRVGWRTSGSVREDGDSFGPFIINQTFIRHQ